MDLTSGFYNMPLHEEDKRYSAFTTPMGLYEYNRLPQGLCNSPASFMRMMMGIFGDQNFLSLLCYLDDLLVFAPNEAIALERLEMVFVRLRSHNLKLASKKCFFLRKSVKFLGHVINEDGVSTDPGKVESVANLTSAQLMEEDGVTPCQKRIRSFLGMINYYQHFVPNYSAIAKPLFDLLSGQKRKYKGTRKSKQASQYRKLNPTDWTPEHQQAFDRLKESLVNTAVLAHPDFTRPFLLSTDASQDGISAVLSQIQDGGTRARPIAFASKSLSRSQKNYPAHRLVFLALKWSICDKFSHWLKGHKFTVFTDNNPLTHIMSKPKLDCCEQRWVAKLASFDFDIKYVPGTQNIVADALSRVPFVKSNMGYRLLNEPFHSLIHDVQNVSSAAVQDAFRWSTDPSGREMSPHPPAVCLQSLAKDDVAAILQSQKEWETGVRSRAVEVLHHLPQIINTGHDTLPAYSVEELHDAQLKDKILSRVLMYVERRRRPSRHDRVREPASVLRYLKHWEKLIVTDGILYRVSKDQFSRTKRFQFVVPDSLKSEVLKGIHDHVGHQGQFRSLSLARQRFFWVHMDRDVREYVRHCQRCIVSKAAEPEGRAPLENITSTRPLQLVCIGFWSAEDASNKSIDVLVVTDHFSRLAHAFVCKNQSAKQVARVLWDKYFCVYGFPERIHSDQGASFENQLISELLRISGIRKSHTTPYHPMGNGSVERFNRTLGNMIRALSPERKYKGTRKSKQASQYRKLKPN
uniref:Gypsy retrotransposon integrase-like protein 1 n=1 Tax=Astyanax mexicanus TaxID=7994 RepID=A0A3B1JAQ3_ASTMX